MSPASVSVEAAPQPGTTAVCLNCDARLDGPYCARCGQSAGVGRLTLRGVAHEFVKQVVELDHGLPHTIVELVKHPGPVIRGIFAGRRRSYTGPVTYALLATAASLVTDDANPKFRAAAEALARSPAATSSVYSPRQAELLHQMQSTMSTNKFVFIASLTVPMVLTFWLFFRKRGINLAEAGTFACYAFGTATFVALPFAVPFVVVANVPAHVAVVSTVMIAYLLYAGFAVFGTSFSTLWRLAGALIGGILLVGIVPAAIVLIVAR